MADNTMTVGELKQQLLSFNDEDEVVVETYLDIISGGYPVLSEVFRSFDDNEKPFCILKIMPENERLY